MTTLDQKYRPIVVKDDDDLGRNRSSNQPLIELARTRLSRRTAIKAFVTTAVAGALGGTLTSRIALAAGAGDPSSLDFTSIKQAITEHHYVADGYSADVLIRWGDKVLPDAPAWDSHAQAADAQARQFGYNCDYLAYFPLPKGSNSSEHGLLHANHEYTNPELMFAGWVKSEGGPPAAEQAAAEARRKALDEGKDQAAAEEEAKAAADKAAAAAITAASREAQTPEQTRIEMMAHNGTVIEVRKEKGKWAVVPDSNYARRITLDTEMRISGPAAGHERMRTGYDPSGTKVFGTLNNCAGGRTPWGTVLMAEENFHGYFGGADPTQLLQARSYERYGIEQDARYPWYRSVERFNIAKEPNEPNRFGWMVEHDPYDPASVPVKRTALGRFKHEGATSIVNQDGRVVLYSGDDERFDYLYRFVTRNAFDPDNLQANRDLLDDGTLYVAKFDEDKVRWLPLVFGEGLLTPENDFQSQADVLIETRRAADLLGATPMDRPEDVEPNPANGRVYVMLTNNSKRTEEQVDAVNPRAGNAHGQIVELIPPGAADRPTDSLAEGRAQLSHPSADHAADVFDWDFLLIAGNPAQEGSGARYHPDAPAWLSSPDNCAFDARGRIWISTDQGEAQLKNNIPDGMFACDLSGDGRAYVKFFYACPIGAEMCGPEFTPDGKTLFVAVQHPAEVEESTFDKPATRWPDFTDGVPPRPSVVTITKNDGGIIGG